MPKIQKIIQISETNTGFKKKYFKKILNETSKKEKRFREKIKVHSSDIGKPKTGKRCLPFLGGNRMSPKLDEAWPQRRLSTSGC